MYLEGEYFQILVGKMEWFVKYRWVYHLILQWTTFLMSLGFQRQLAS